MCAGDCLLVNFGRLTMLNGCYSCKVAPMQKAPQGHETPADFQKAMLCLITFRQMME